jgi:hypothetical protein
MKSLDEFDSVEEQTLVEAAFRSKSARAKLQRHARAMAAVIASFYRERDQTLTTKRMADTAMRQFNAVLNEYENRRGRSTAKRCRFSLYWAHWTTMRIEQLVRRRR